MPSVTPRSTARWPGRMLNKPVVGITGTPTGDGYWLVAVRRGDLRLRQSAVFRGSMGGTRAEHTGRRDGGHRRRRRLLAGGRRRRGSSPSGCAPFSGSIGGTTLNRPVVGDGNGRPGDRRATRCWSGPSTGYRGSTRPIQAAVNAAQPGDWILIAPGDYHEQADHRSIHRRREDRSPSVGTAGVAIHTNDIHLRGMNRNSVVVDGTKPGAPQCSSNPADQDLGVLNPSSDPLGRNGIDIWANGDSVDNLTVCNFQLVEDGAGNQAGNGGNEIWWDGGDGTGKIGLIGYEGSYLTATDTFNGAVRADRPSATTASSPRNRKVPGFGTRPMPTTSLTPACTSEPANSSATRGSTTRGWRTTPSGTPVPIRVARW